MRHRAGEDGTRVGDRVDRAFVVLRGSKRAAIIVVPAAVPLTIPRIFKLWTEAPGGCVARGDPPHVIPRLCHGDESADDAVDEEAEPCALAAALRADVVHAVVPVAGTE